MNSTHRFMATLIVGLLLSCVALAQDDQAAGLFTEARQLPVVAQALRARVVGDRAEVHLVQVFANDGEEVGQADYRLHLPEQASVVGFGFWDRGRFVAATLKEKEEAKKAHARAASAGRSTAILHREHGIHSFSVFPLRAGEHKRVQVTLQLPVEMEMGRLHLRLPLDRFLGQRPVAAAVTVEIETEAPIAGFGVEGSQAKVVSRRDRSVSLALTAREPIDVWWHEEVPPLLTRAQLVPISAEEGEGDGSLGAQIQVALHDGGEWRAPYDTLHLLVDTSFSMRRRAGSLVDLVGRVLDQAPVAVAIHGVGERGSRIAAGHDPQVVVQRLLQERDGHTCRAEQLVLEAERLGCHRPEVRCAAVTDLQLPGLEALARAELPTLFLADPQEAAFFTPKLSPQARVFQTGVDATARLLQLADQLVLPVLLVEAVELGGTALALIGQPALKVAEGGMLRLHALVDRSGPLQVRASIEGRPLVRTIFPEQLDAESERGRSVRRRVYGELLAGWMADYRAAPDGELKQRIVRTSLREEIPTAFTSLHAVDPRLSLFATKPGDPLLTVPAAPGLEEVVAWYPFGEMRRLVYDPRAGTFTDRFLVPRGWRERLYRIEIFKAFDDGRVEEAHAWYQIDERGPSAQITFDPAEGLVRVETGAETPAVGSVQVHGEGGEALTLSPIGDAWLVPVDDLPPVFTIFVRDRAGNRTAFACRFESGELKVEQANPRPHQSPAPEPMPVLEGSKRGDSALQLERGVVSLRLGDRVVRFTQADARLRSLELSSWLRLDEEELLFGTVGGDLVRLVCGGGDARCSARPLGGGLAFHPVTGMALLDQERVLVGVLGRGLFELRGEQLRRSRLRVGSRFVTAVLRRGRGVFVGTAYRGLWRVGPRGASRTRFPHDHVSGLRSTAVGIEVESGFGRFLRTGRGRFSRVSPGLDRLRQGAPGVTAAVEVDGRLFLAGFDTGLTVLEGKERSPWVLGLSPAERRINALALHGGRLFLGTEGGLLELSAGEKSVARYHLPDVAVHDLAVTSRGLAVASSDGLYLLTEHGALERVDFQAGVGTSKFMSVAEFGGTLYAGGMEGLYRFDGDRALQVTSAHGFDANWVTALLPDGDRLLVGTYDRGLYAFDGSRAAPVAGLEAQWVPPRSLARIDDAVWVGGTGMPAARLTDGGKVHAVAVPARDVNSFVAVSEGLLLLTSDGVATVHD